MTKATTPTTIQTRQSSIVLEDDMSGQGDLKVTVLTSSAWSFPILMFVY